MTVTLADLRIIDFIAECQAAVGGTVGIQLIPAGACDSVGKGLSGAVCDCSFVKPAAECLWRGLSGEVPEDRTGYAAALADVKAAIETVAEWPATHTSYRVLVGGSDPERAIDLRTAFGALAAALSDPEQLGELVGGEDKPFAACVMPGMAHRFHKG